MRRADLRGDSFSKMAQSPLLVEAQLESVFLRELFDLCFPIFLV
jgi:hypothetical protein